jgi:ABC-type polysaccharide/polyol phosphate export permease
VPFPRSSAIVKAVQDFTSGICSIHVWPMLGWQEIRLRYRRSTLGPIWLTISKGALIAAMGPLYGRLLGQNIGSYYPYLAVGYVVWIFVSSVINDACTVFINAEGMIKQIRMPLTIHVLRMVWRNSIVLLHNFIIVAIVLAFFPPRPSWHLIFVPLGLAAIALNGVWVGLILGTLCSRFRDVSQLVGSIVQVAFFLTPVLWHPAALGEYRWVAAWNPLTHFLDIVREPLLGYPIDVRSVMIVVGVTASGYAAALLLFARYRARIPYWV